MTYEMIIDVGREGERIALLKDKKLVELHQEKSDSENFLVGEIYLGTRYFNCLFVFLHYCSILILSIV